MELSLAITSETVEAATKRVNLARARDNARADQLARQALRAAQARDPKLLLALEKGAAVLRTMSEAQMGVHGADQGGQRVEAGELQVWRNAYDLCDMGKSRRVDPHELAVYQWIYAAAGLLAGVVV